MIRPKQINILALVSWLTACSDGALFEESSSAHERSVKGTNEKKQVTVQDAKIDQDEGINQEFENEHEVFQKSDSNPGDGTGEDLVNVPVMTTGAFLASCSWNSESTGFSCNIESQDEAPSDLQFVLKDKDGALISTELYQVETRTEGNIVQIIVSIEEEIESWTLEALSSEGDIKLKIPSDKVIFEEDPMIAETPSNEPGAAKTAEINADLTKVLTYTETNFSGTFQEYDLGSYEFTKSKLASIRVPSSYAIELCDISKCANFYGDVEDLLSYTDQVISMRVYESEPFVSIFTENNFAGDHQILSTMTYLYADLVAGIGDDSVSSCHISPGLQVKMCEHPNGSGFCDSYTTAVAQLGLELNDDVSHIEVGFIDELASTLDNPN